MSKIIRMNEWGVPAGVKSLWNKAKGHNLPRVKVPKEMTADQRERAYTRFKKTAGSTVSEENKLDRVKGILRKMFRKPIKGGEEKQSDLGEDTTVPRKKWNPIPKFQDVTRGIDKGHVIPRGGDMTTTDPRSGLPMMVVKKKARGDLNKRKRKSNPGSNEGLGQDPEI